jgi:hypothetical protein
MTVKANELRIGNLVQQDDGKVYSIKASQLHNNEVLGRWPIQINPIPLTEEWLLRFGFELRADRIKNIHYTEYGIGKFIIATHQEVDYWCLLGYEVNIKDIHQLQNLYFALTGEELKLNEEIL